MGDFFRQQYGELPLRYEELYDDELYEDYYEDPNKFISRIEGTELEFGVAFLGSNYFPIMTSRVNKGKRKYYLFDFIKVWQTNNVEKIISNCDCDCGYYED